MTAGKTPEDRPKKAAGRSTAGSASSAKGGRKPAAKKTTRKAASKPAAKKTKAPALDSAEEAVADAAQAEKTVAAEGAEAIREEPMEERADDSPAVTEPVVVQQEAGLEGAAVDLLQAPEPDQDEGGSSDLPSDMADKIIAFQLAGQHYAVPIGVVQEIQQIVEFSEIPAAGGAVVGMVNLRGSVIPAIDMRFLIGLEPREYALDTPMIICHAHGQLVALVVDHVEDVMTMPAGCLDPPPNMHSLSTKMIGVCRMDSELVYLLEVENLVAPVELPRGR